MSLASDKRQASEWARRLLAKPAGKVLILDTETAKLNGEIIELAIIDLDGNTVYNQRFNPVTNIDPGAYLVHGISHLMLMDEPRFVAEYERVRDILAAAEIVLIYNSPYDARCLDETCELHSVAEIEFKSGCIMRMYAQWFGEMSPRGGYKWQKLTGGDHSAVGDAKAALELLREMAGMEVVIG